VAGKPDMLLGETMGKLAKKQAVGGTAFYLSDCHVWAEINYLDSPTDYRECLPTAAQGRSIETNDPWGRSNDSHRLYQGSFYCVVFLACMFLLVLGLFLHLSSH